MKSILVLFVKAYQLCVAPYFGKACRFEPSCSNYALEAIDKYGALRGGGKAVKRLVKCGPWHPGGVDQP